MAFLLQIRMSWLRCELAERAFKTGGGAGRVLAPLPVLSAGKATGAGVLWRCRKLAVQAAYILVPVAYQR